MKVHKRQSIRPRQMIPKITENVSGGKSHLVSFRNSHVLTKMR